jgi:hypothetical protein
MAGLPAFADFTQPITAEAWVKIPYTAAARAEGIVGFGNSWKLGFRPDGRLAFTMFGVVDATADVYPQVGVWTHIAAVWEPGVGITCYVDGANVAFFPETRPMRAAQNTFLGIGSAGTSGEPINASIDRVRVHQAALTADQLDSVAATPKAPLPSTLASFDLNETIAPYASGGQAAGRATIFGQDYLLTQASPHWNSSSPSRQAGDTSLEFDGNDHIIVPDVNQIVTFPTGDFTAQAWVNFTNNLPGAKSVLFMNNGPGGAISFSVSSDRRVFVTTLGIADIPSQAFIPNDGLWHHIAVVHKNGVEMKFYVDGILRDTIPYTGGVITTRTETSFAIGSETSGGFAYRGLLDRVQLSDEALTADDLDYLPVPGVTPGTPELEIGTAVSVAWPLDVSGYILQSTTDLTEPRVWTDVGAAQQAVGDKHYVLLPVPNQQTYYRLVRPPSE